MAISKCPDCGCRQFYVKSPDDEYDIYDFECRDGKAYFQTTSEEGVPPEMNDGIEAYCNACAWHGKFNLIK